MQYINSPRETYEIGKIKQTYSESGPRELESELVEILERMADAFLLLDKQWRFTYLNHQAEIALEQRHSELLGKKVWDVFDAEDPFFTAYKKAVTTQSVEKFTAFHAPTAKWFEVRAYPSASGLSVFLQDITEHKQNLARLELLEAAIAASSNGVVISDMLAADQPLIYCNPAFEKLTGYGPSDIIGRNCRFLQGPDTDQTEVDKIRACIREGKNGRVVLKNYRKDGTPFWNELIISPVRDRSGQVTHFIGVQKDITARRQAEAALRKSEARFQRLAANVPGMIYQFRLSGDGSMSFPYLSPGCLELLEIDPTVGQSNISLMLDVIHPRDRQSFDDSVAVSAATLAPWRWQGRFITPSGKLKWLQAASRPEKQANGDIIWDGLMIDISDRILAEEKLRKSEANLAEAQKVAHIGSWELDVATKAVTWSAEIFGIFGLDPMAAAPTFSDRQIHPGDRELWLESMQQGLTEGKPYELDVRIIRPDGQIRYVQAKGKPTLNAEGQVTKLFNTVLDITERKQTEAALWQHIQMLDLANDTIMIQELDGTVVYWNQGAEQLYGWKKKEAIGANVHSLLQTVWPQDSLDGAKNRCIERGYWQGELLHTKRDGQQITVASRWTLQRDENGDPFAILEINNDITERKQAEVALREASQREREKALQLERTLQELQRTQTQLVQNEKMISLGQIVAGVAHEINNPVSFIYSNLTHADIYARDILELLQLYQQYYPDPTPEIEAIASDIELDFLTEDFPRLMDSMKVGAERIRQIVLSLRNFSRLDEASFKQVNIHEGLESTLLILQHRLHGTTPGNLVGRKIQVIKEYGDLPPVQCYPGELNQVFMNILANAIDALEECQNISNPQIRITTQLIEGQRVRISIADNGPGMTESVQLRLFDPFFTSKPVGKGTGLGLSISYQTVVEQHHGHLSCVSAPDLGAEFIIEIPLKQQS
ncbi:MAG: PAS domain S-box protein [Hormoscilla sp.]